jgi:hypothetical protein
VAGSFRRTVIASVVALVVLAPVISSPVPARAYASAVQPDTFGVNMQYVYWLGQQGASGQPGWKPFMDLATKSGMTVIREDAAWSTAEPNGPDLITGAHTYTWSDPGSNFSYDKWATDLAVDGIRWQPILDYSTSWASTIPGNDRAPPLHDSDFATYVTAFARRYGRNGSFWSGNPTVPYTPVTTYEIWNEENAQFFWTTGCDPARYGDLFLAAASALRQVDPAATIVVGGLADIPSALLQNCSPEDFIRGLKQNRPQVFSVATGMGLHPYGGYIPDVEGEVNRFRTVMDSEAGATTMPLYLTEYGWDSDGFAGGLPDTSTTGQPNRATALKTTANDLSMSNCLVRNIMIHTWRTPEQNHSNGEDWFGIAHPALDPTTGQATLWGSGQAYSDTVLNITGRGSTPPPTGTVRVCTGRP